MAKKATAKKPLTGNKRSHALNATKMQQKPNLQKTKINGKSVRVSAREMKKDNYLQYFEMLQILFLLLYHFLLIQMKLEYI